MHSHNLIIKCGELVDSSHIHAENLARHVKSLNPVHCDLEDRLDDIKF